jgi:thiol-disulfide isomerase/thioredoxin
VLSVSALSSVYLYVGDTSRAERIASGVAARTPANEGEQAEILLASMQFANAMADPFAGINEKAEAIVRRIDALSDSMLVKKMAAHSSMLGRYQYADIDDGIQEHAAKLLPLARRAIEVRAFPMTAARPAQGTRKAVPSYDPAYMYLASAYSGLARAQGDNLHADSAIAILDRGDKEIGEAYPYANFESDRGMYRLVGTRAATVSGKWWVNALDGTSVQPGNGKVTIVQFTAHWCVPCKKSYPPMLRLMTKYKGQPVESVMSTGIYGYLGDKQNLTPEQEVAADREYYKEHHGLPFPVAINPRGAGADDQYKVGGIPEIVIVDRKGIIRATVVGWDKGNEARFATLIEQLLAEK